jgi:hypothetical protein
MSASSNPTNYNLHTRPRLGSIDVLKLPPTPQAHGGLSAGAMRRVREYVEVHLGESIDPSMLAGVAALSVHHFARQFKQSAGGDLAPLPHEKGSETRPGDASSNGSLVSGCRRLFRPRSSSASFPPYARYYASRVSVVTTLATSHVFEVPFANAYGPSSLNSHWLIIPSGRSTTLGMH